MSLAYRALRALAVLAFALYLIALGYLYINQRALIFVRDAQPVNAKEIGLDRGVDIEIGAADGETLRAIRIAPRPGKPLLLYFPGQAGGFQDRAERFRRLTATGDGLLAINYRGYGGSTGSPSEAGLYADAEATYEEAIRESYPPKQLVVVGESLGTGVATELAAHHEIGALVLDSPYSAIADVAASRYPLFPVKWLIEDPFRAEDSIGQVKAPILMIHGEADRVVPIRFAERLFALAPAPKTFWPVPGAGHLALGKRIPETLDWIDAALGR